MIIIKVFKYFCFQIPYMQTTFDIPVLNVTLLEPRKKHPTIFNQFDALPEGEAFRILNDHDPKPLYYQLLAERGGTFTWTYLQNGPQDWEVEIRKVVSEETIGTIAAKDLRKAEVFKNFGIDFCCGGKKTIKEACEESGLDLSLLTLALTVAETGKGKAEINSYLKWEPDFLADYIINQHHSYYYEEAPIITELLEKVVNRHGSSMPKLFDLQKIFLELKHELDTHFKEEEEFLFPYIKEMVKARRSGNGESLKPFTTIEKSILQMEMEHKGAGILLTDIRKLTGDHVPPEAACNSLQLLFNKLKALEDDLHQHIHLENNLLFPKALELEKSLRKTT